MAWVNFHTHCSYCHGEGEPEDYVLAAIKKGFPAIGFSPHAPMPFSTDWHVEIAKYQDYVATINALKGKYNYRIEIYCGIELDWYPEHNTDSQLLDVVDYHIGSVHYLSPFPNGDHFLCDYSQEVFIEGLNRVYNGDVEKLVDDYYSRLELMIVERRPDIIGHLELVGKFNQGNKFFNPNQQWYIERIAKVLDLIRKTGAIVEVNTRSMYKGLVIEPCPSLATIKMCFERGIPVTISADAHSPKEIDAGMEQTAKELLKIGYQDIGIFYQDKWRQVKFNSMGIVL